MKIQSLSITGRYKNIENLNFEFSKDKNITLLVGQNGLGKSNLIEILALIFRDLDLMQKEEDFINWSYEKEHNFSFKLVYKCKGNQIKIDSSESIFKIQIAPVNSNSIAFQEIGIKEFIKRRHEEFLPNFIIGYYSGENKRIKKIIRKHEEIQFKELKEWNSANLNNKEPGLRRLFFTENLHSQLILLTLMLYKNSNIRIGEEKLSHKINQLLSEYLCIHSIEKLHLIFNSPSWYEFIKKESLGVDYLVSNINDKVKYPFWHLKGKIDHLLMFFYENNDQIPRGYEEKKKNEYKKNVIQEFLEFAEFNIHNLLKNIHKEYKKPIHFFDAIESTSIVDVLNKILITSRKVGINDPIEFAELSEGEQQLITSIGLLLLTCQDDCLYLFDEPDTHLNPKWQRNYIDLIHDFNLNKENSHIILATHSPLIVQASEKGDSFLFKKDEKGRILIEKNSLMIENWRIDQVLVSDFFELSSARPPQIDEFMKKRKEILTKSELSEKDLLELKALEDEFGTLPTGETLNEIKAMVLINKVANNLKDDIYK